MSDCRHRHQRKFSLLPSIFIHDEYNHDCGCVKCYLSDIVSAAKIEFVWMIEYVLLFITFNSESNKIRTEFFYSSFCPRSPPLYK